MIRKICTFLSLACLSLLVVVFINDLAAITDAGLFLFGGGRFQLFFMTAAAVLGVKSHEVTPNGGGVGTLGLPAHMS